MQALISGDAHNVADLSGCLHSFVRAAKCTVAFHIRFCSDWTDQQPASESWPHACRPESRVSWLGAPFG
jgi:hypothetical protein